jgi:ABC-type antimicrobial peptide transport system permease subunit
VETLIPVGHDPQSAEGREALGIGAFGPAAVQPFRYRPGDDASCLNLYAPENPRVIAPTDAFLGEGRFRFSGSLAETEAERENPWLLLGRTFGDGAIPVIADANSITYVLDRKIGEDILLSEGGRTLRLRLVAALADSIFQGELLMSDENFRNAFPNRTGYSLFLVEGSGLAESLENALEDHGVRVTPTAERLAAFHRVENTYLSTFQALGALGLLLGTLGLGAVMMRNVLERRRELALMRALCYGRRDLVAMAMAESASVLLRGLVTGLLAALVAIAPALLEQGGRLPGALILGLLVGVLALGLITSLATTVIALRPPLLPALRSD